MGLARVYSKIGSLLINRFNQAAGPSSKRVDAELDNLIAWAKTAKRCIKRDVSVVNSSGVGPDVLHTFDLPANSLQTDGDYLDVWYAGNFATNARAKAVQAQFDGTDYEAPGITSLEGTVGWIIAVRIIRLSSTTVRISNCSLENAVAVNAAGVATSYSAGGNMFARNNASIGCANLNSNAITMRVRSVVQAGAAAADVVQNLSIIELCQQ